MLIFSYSLIQSNPISSNLIPSFISLYFMMNKFVPIFYFIHFLFIHFFTYLLLILHPSHFVFISFIHLFTYYPFYYLLFICPFCFIIIFSIFSHLFSSSVSSNLLNFFALTFFELETLFARLAFYFDFRVCILNQVIYFFLLFLQYFFATAQDSTS